eukprot:1218152-Ditylum_brightwellii.AAC.1
MLNAENATYAVSVKQLYPCDLHDLANSIQEALIDWRKRMPLSSILGLIRIMHTMLTMEQSRCDVSCYNRVGVKSYLPIDSEMTWAMAMKFLNRSKKLLRRLRCAAMGPASKRPRRLFLPKESIKLYLAYEKDPDFSLESFSSLKKGSKAACQLFKWVQYMVSVYQTQDEFIDGNERNCIPTWFIRLCNAHRNHRHALIQIYTMSRCLCFIKSAKQIPDSQ